MYVCNNAIGVISKVQNVFSKCTILTVQKIFFFFFDTWLFGLHESNDLV